MELGADGGSKGAHVGYYGGDAAAGSMAAEEPARVDSWRHIERSTGSNTQQIPGCSMAIP